MIILICREINTSIIFKEYLIQQYIKQNFLRNTHAVSLKQFIYKKTVIMNKLTAYKPLTIEKWCRKYYGLYN